MALYWPEARVVVRCEGSTEWGEEWPPGVIVIAMRPEQADDVDFIETIRDLVIDRTIERRRLMLDYIFESGDQMPEPRGGELREGVEPTEADEAESRLKRHLIEDAGGPQDDDRDDAGEKDAGPEAWRGIERAYEGTCLGLGPMESPNVLLVISHCDRMVVSG